MGVFFLDQRWTSEGEPELGVGVVTELGNGRVKIEFRVAGETRLYAMEDAPLRRVLFKEGETITDKNQRPFFIERVQVGQELILYIGAEGVLSEADLGEVTVQHGVDDKLLMGEVDTPQLFALRRKTLAYDQKRRVSSVSGFVGGRIDLIPHQLYIAHEVSERYAPRVLLSDQVGLGKTIEACLIIHRLLLNGRASRVLILVPDSLLHQWFVEMLRRFNLWFHIFDEERCLAIEENAPEGNPFLDDQLIICSTSLLAKSPLRAQQALRADWDLLVVDEAHHLEWSVAQASPEYAIVELLSQVAKGLLLLTATPEQLGVESHFARLRLLDPERYNDFEEFKNESQDNSAIANIVEDLAANKKLKSTDKQLLEDIFDKDKLEKTLAVKQYDDLIEDLLDQYGPGRVIFRNTRSAMKGFPKRKAYLIPITAKDQHQEWVKTLTAEYLVDKESVTNQELSQEIDFSNDPRIDWLLRQMEIIAPAKALLICKSKEKVLALEKILLQEASFNVGVFHEDLTIVQRDRNAAWFAEKEGARLLLCSEIGSEGRNFQFAHYLILFDLPAHPELLEQRIGRLDRIGQTEDIQIYVPYLKGSPQEILVKWYHEGLNAFEENIEGGNQTEHLFAERLEKLAFDDKAQSKETDLARLILETSKYQQETKEILAKGRDRLLEMNSFRPQRAAVLVETIQAEDLDNQLEHYMIKMFDQFGVDVEDLAPRTYLLHPSRTNDTSFPSVPDQGVSITFDRKKALSREDMSFVSWDHPMVTGAIDMMLSEGAGNTSYGILRDTGDSGVLLEVLFVLEITGGKELHVDRFLPNTPLRVVVDHIGTEVTDEYPAELIDQKLIPGQLDNLIENETFAEVIIPNMIASAVKQVEQLGEDQKIKALKQMDAKLNHEIDRLELLQRKNKHIRPEEMLLALKEKSALAQKIKAATVRMDAIQLIQKT